MSVHHLNCEDFISELSSKNPIPGGGGASALCAAIGMALGCMVGNISAQKTNPETIQNKITELNVKASSLQTDFLNFIDADGEAFMPLINAYRLPKENEEQIETRLAAIEQALINASCVPIQLMQKICEAIDLHFAYEKIGTAAAISDVGVGIALCRASLLGASLNVFINTKSMKDKKKALSLEKQAQDMLDRYIELADLIYANVLKKLQRGG
jgi:formiminotetrahydrofolate cyclodeaminase